MDLEQQCRAVKTPADLRNLPGYVARVNPALVGLERVIWPYYFRTEEVQCSLTNCGAHHKEGVIIQLDDGSVSNIGHICGHDANKYSTKFGTEMLKMSEGALRDTMLPMLLDRAGLEKIAGQVRAVYHAGQRWTKRMAAFSTLFPDVVQEVARRFASGSSMTVSDVVQRSESEVDDLVASGQFSSRQAARYRDVSKGAIQGTGMLVLTSSKLESLWRRADSLLAADPLALEPGLLRALFADANGLPAQAQEVARACDAAEAFFTAANFSVMNFLPMSPTARDRLAALTLVSLDAHVEKIAKDRFEGGAASVKPLSKKQRDHWRRAGLKPPG
jgi:hypothetical protein